METESTKFETHLLSKLKQNRFNFHLDNYDFFFRGPLPADQQPGLNRVIQKVKNEAADVLKSEQLVSTLKSKLKDASNSLKAALTYRFLPETHFKAVLDRFKEFSFLYDKLSDARSKEILISLLAYRALGFRRVKLDRNNPDYWQGIESARALATKTPAIRIPFLTWPLNCFDMRPLGFDMSLFTYAQAVAINFVQMQYVLKRENVLCKAEPGDVVIDAGGCWGDTALQFACEVGSKGHVFTFEFVPTNLMVMRKNFALNPHLQPLITIIENPVGGRHGEKMFFFENGPGSRVAATKVDDRYMECSVVTIDQIVAEKKIQRVDFVKMDVEGSELAALKGAEKTLRTFKPKLAICIYHKPDDYETIPRYIDSLRLGYRFFVDHHTIYLNETVLFAVPESRT